MMYRGCSGGGVILRKARQHWHLNVVLCCVSRCSLLVGGCRHELNAQMGPAVLATRDQLAVKEWNLLSSLMVVTAAQQHALGYRDAGWQVLWVCWTMCCYSRPQQCLEWGGCW